MKKIFISLACLSVLLVFSGSAVAYTYVVYKQANGPCTTGNYYYNDSQSYTCSKQSLERTPPPACDSININYGCGPIQYAYDSAYVTSL
ncbi:MAG: hypothetical protein HY758_08735 [Nitrospirae bacterium]|nr:hypothetical protein [Nitrospirota bacterium]